MIEWFEDLPPQCPPKEAIAPNGMKVYRFSSNDEPTEHDFLSQRMLNPDREFKNISECVSRSLSVFNDIQECKNRIKLPRNRKRFKQILEVELTDMDGLILKTFTHPNHYSWWRSKAFNWETVSIIDD